MRVSCWGSTRGHRHSERHTAPPSPFQPPLKKGIVSKFRDGERLSPSRRPTVTPLCSTRHLSSATSSRAKTGRLGPTNYPNSDARRSERWTRGARSERFTVACPSSRRRRFNATRVTPSVGGGGMTSTEGRAPRGSNPRRGSDDLLVCSRTLPCRRERVMRPRRAPGAAALSTCRHPSRRRPLPASSSLPPGSR